jgi:hypothetical protein
MKIFYGTYYLFNYPNSGYMNAYYGGIYGYPFTLKSNLTILNVDRNGTVNASYMDRPVILKTGEICRSPVDSRIENRTFEVVSGDKYFNTCVYQPFLVLYYTSWSVENKGMFDKTNIDRSYSEK